VSDDVEYGDTCSLLSTSESIADRSQCPSRLSLGGASKGGLHKPRTEDDDGQGMSYAIPNFLLFPSSITTTTITTTARPARTIGILKRDPLEQIPVDTRRKSWKKLPVPDLNQNQMGNRSTRSVNSRCSGSSSIPSDDDSFHSSQSCGSSLAEGVPGTPTRIPFESVQTRLHHQTLGDNPAVKYGPPIALDWEYEEMSPVQVDEYEGTRA
jgi:hypothetical protein